MVILTAFNNILPVAQCRLPVETEEDYVWAFNMLRLLMVERDIGLPSVIVTDRDLPCMNAVDNVFPGIPAMICWWQMNP